MNLLHRLRQGGVPVGGLGPVRDEPIRFRHATSLTFHASDVEAIESTDQKVILTSTFLGLYGTASPLAVHFSEDVISAEQSDEHSLREFYDLFHHRLLSLFYGAWKKYRLHSGFRLAGDDPTTKRLLCFVGVDGHGAHAESGLSRLELLELAPLLSMRARPPRVLQLALQRVFPGVIARIEPF
ncbi:MAG TPA: type VI secretion system baseplate subunit TssG, partial [Polyangiaceae bacterium]|nr:type VI secretion system baseplate subunit TssG [Polyangiaceae bacterium]